MSDGTIVARERLEKAVVNLPPEKLEQLSDYAEYLQSKEEWEATMEILNDPAMKQEVESGLQEVQQGKGKSWRDIQKNV